MPIKWTCLPFSFAHKLSPECSQSYLYLLMFNIRQLFILLSINGRVGTGAQLKLYVRIEQWVSWPEMPKTCFTSSTENTPLLCWRRFVLCSVLLMCPHNPSRGGMRKKKTGFCEYNLSKSWRMRSARIHLLSIEMRLIWRSLSSYITWHKLS